MHISPLNAATSHEVPFIHIQDLIHNRVLQVDGEAAKIRTFAAKRIRENGRKHGICPECLEANIAWYERSFDYCVTRGQQLGRCNPTYPPFESPCWKKPEIAALYGLNLPTIIEP